MTWREVFEALNKLTGEQLDKEAIAIIDAEPWPASKFKIAPANDPQYPDQPFLIFE